MPLNERLTPRLAATGEKPRPGSFCLGSAQSRAAARALLERRSASVQRVDFIVEHIAPSEAVRPRLGKWTEWPDGSLMRVSHLPNGMTIEEAERLVA